MDSLTDHLVTRLEESRRRTLECFRLPAPALDLTYAPGKWSVCLILHHLADTEAVLYERIRRVISEPKGVIWAFDQDAWATGLDYATYPLPISERIFDALRSGMIHLVHSHLTRSGGRQFVHSQSGVRTLREEFEEVARHNDHHLRQIEQALGGHPPGPLDSVREDATAAGMSGTPG
jgi:hypothetical protein